jgi:hypothetical protein
VSDRWPATDSQLLADRLLGGTILKQTIRRWAKEAGHDRWDDSNGNSTASRRVYIWPLRLTPILSSPASVSRLPGTETVLGGTLCIGLRNQMLAT